MDKHKKNVTVKAVTNKDSSSSEKTCTSIFKDGTTATSQKVYTRTWINLINHLEKNNGLAK